jgi:hypothetical protein
LGLGCGYGRQVLFSLSFRSSCSQSGAGRLAEQLVDSVRYVLRQFTYGDANLFWVFVDEHVWILHAGRHALLSSCDSSLPFHRQHPFDGSMSCITAVALPGATVRVFGLSVGCHE